MYMISFSDRFSLIPTKRRSKALGNCGEPTDKGFSVYRWLGLSVMVPDADFAATVIAAIKAGAVEMTDAASFHRRLAAEASKEATHRTEYLEACNKALTTRETKSQEERNRLYGENVTLRKALYALTGHELMTAMPLRPCLLAGDDVIERLISHTFPLARDADGAVLSLLAGDFGPGQLNRLLLDTHDLEADVDVDDILIPFANEAEARAAAEDWLAEELVATDITIDLWVAQDGQWTLAEPDILNILTAE